MLNKKSLFIFGIIAIALTIAGFVYSQSQSEMQNELDSLISDLNNEGYGWLVDYSVFEESSCQYVSSIENVSEEGLYKTYLNGLEGSSDIFDLKIFGSLEFDYIVDPYYLNVSTDSTGSNVTTEGQYFSHLNLDVTGEEYASFDGVDDYVNVGNQASLNLEDENFSAFMWINAPVSEELGVLLSKATASDPRWLFNIQTGGYLRVYANGDVQQSSDTLINDSSWHFVGFTVDRSIVAGVKIYVDGVEESSYSDTIDATAIGNVSNSESFEIARYGSGFYFNGSMDEVMVFNRLLSQSEISSLYALNRGDSNISSTGLVGYWTFDDDTLAADSSGEGNDGSLEGGTSVVLDKSYPYSMGNGLTLYMPFDVNTSGTTYDYSGNNNDGTLQNGVDGHWTSSGWIGGAYEFDGVDDYIDVPDLTFNITTDNYTISTWVYKPTGSATAWNGFTGGNIDGTGGYWILGQVGSIYFYQDYYNSTVYGWDTNLDFGNQLSYDTWEHIVIESMIYNSTHSNLSVYINGGESSATKLFYNSPITTTFKFKEIGRGEGVRYLDSSLDEVMIFNRTLNSTEVSELYNNQSSRFYPTGELFFDNLNFGSKDVVNITLDGCGTEKGSYLQGKVNNGNWQNFSSCSFTDYSISGDSSDANFTVRLVSDGNLFYSPVVIGNISLNEGWSDTTVPSVAVNSPRNNSYANSNVKFDALISDSTSANTYAFINDSDLAGYWTFDTTNSTGVLDTSGNDNFGSFNGGLGISNISDGMFGDALEFGGSGEYLLVPDNDSLDIMDSGFSFSFWAKPNPTFVYSTQGSVLTKGGAGSSVYGYRVLADTNADEWSFWVSNTTIRTQAITTGDTLVDNTWQHVVGICNRDDYRIYIYVNGQDRTSGTPVCPLGTNNAVNDLEIGMLVGTGREFNGTLDEIMVFNRSLSEDEILALYNSSSQKFNISYSLDSGLNIFDLIAVDESANINLTQFFVTNDVVKPTIVFEDNTPANGGSTSNDYVEINTTITDDQGGDLSSWIDWNKSLVGYWNFENTNSTGVFDNSSYDNFGTFNGDLGEYNLTQGKRGDALEFDGSDDYVDIGTTLNIAENPFSVSAWVYQNDNGANTIIGKWKSGGNPGENSWLFYASASDLYFVVDDDAIKTATMTCSTNSWHHIVGVANGTHIIPYVDGIKGTPVAYDGTINSGSGLHNAIGIFGSSLTLYPINGSLDEVMIFNRTLSATEISALYNNSATRLFGNFTSLSDGTYNYSVYSIDEGGNLNFTTDRQVSVDSTGPTINVLSPVNGTYYNSGSIYVNATASESVSSWFVDYNGTNHSLSINSTFDFLEGNNYNLKLWANDSTNNWGLNDSFNFSVDLTNPLISFVSPTEDNATSFSRNWIYVNVSVTETNEDTINFSLYNTSLWNSTSFTDGTRTINWTGLAEGNYYYNVTVNDSAGNSNNTDTYKITLDTTAPQVTIVLPVAGNSYTSSSVTFQTTTNENSTCNYSIDAGATNTSMSANSAGTIHTASATISTNGNYVANYYCADITGNVNNTQNVSFTIAISSAQGETTSSSSSSSGGGSSSVKQDVQINTNSIERTLSLDKIEFGQIEISNTGINSKKFNINVETINSLVEFESTTLEVAPGETSKFEFRLMPPKEAGIYTGKIIITSIGFRKEIPIVLNVKTETSLFDVIITIPKLMKKLSIGSNLEVQVDLLQMGIKEKMDVTLNYVIKDFEGVVHVIESETIAVTDQKTLQKEFYTEDLPSGEYVLGVELIYPEGVAVASSQFKVKEKIPVNKNNLLMIGAILVLLAIILVIIFSIRRYRRLLKHK